MYVHHFLQMYSDFFFLQVIVPKQSPCVIHDCTTGTGALHFPYLHTLVISSFFKVPYFLRYIFSVIWGGCMSVTSWDCFWVSIPDAGKHLDTNCCRGYTFMLADWRAWNLRDCGILFGSFPPHLCQACFLVIPFYFLSSRTSLTTGYIWSQLLCYWYMTVEQIPPSLEDVLRDHMVYVW